MNLEKIQSLTMDQLKLAYANYANSSNPKAQEIADIIYTEYKNRMEPTHGKCFVSILRTVNSQYYNN